MRTHTIRTVAIEQLSTALKIKSCICRPWPHNVNVLIYAFLYAKLRQKYLYINSNLLLINIYQLIIII